MNTPISSTAPRRRRLRLSNSDTTSIARSKMGTHDGRGEKRKHDSHSHDPEDPTRMRWDGSVCFNQIPPTVEGIVSTFENVMGKACEDARDTLLPMVQDVVDGEKKRLGEAVKQITQLRIEKEKLTSDRDMKAALIQDMTSSLQLIQKISQGERDQARSLLAEVRAQSEHCASENDRLKKENADLQKRLDEANNNLLARTQDMEAFSANVRGFEKHLITFQNILAQVLEEIQKRA
ncbi:hypothetical protein B0H19DRAFT_1200201 [Mycena capillaripes]|nr:hypothetical protein B0H19DRAFT_1200201 [Mycena capillaripes]